MIIFDDDDLKFNRLSFVLHYLHPLHVCYTCWTCYFDLCSLVEGDMGGGL